MVKVLLQAHEVRRLYWMDAELRVLDAKNSVNGVAATTFYNSGIKDWNSLPLDVKQKCTFNGFKSAARQYLRSQMQLMESDTYAYN